MFITHIIYSCGPTCIFVEIFHANNLVLEIFHDLIFVRQGYPGKLFNLEHFPIYGTLTILNNIQRNILIKMCLLAHCSLNVASLIHMHDLRVFMCKLRISTFNSASAY